MRELADEFGFLLVFDEVKTGFRYCLGGYSQLSGVHPDLAFYAKAIANGFPISAIGGKAEYMDVFADPDATRRPLIGGTYNAHPVSVAAAIATIEVLLEGGGAVYRHMDDLGAQIQEGNRILTKSPRDRRSGLSAGGCVQSLPDATPAAGLSRSGGKPRLRSRSIPAPSHDRQRGLLLPRLRPNNAPYRQPITPNDITATLEALERALTSVF